MLPRLRDPLAELIEVVDRGRQADESNVVRREAQRLFPDRPALRVVEKVDLVEDRKVGVEESLGVLEHRVPEDLGGHDDQRCIRVEGQVAGHQPDVDAVLFEVAKLLVGQSFDRTGVDGAATEFDGLLDGVLGDERFA